MDLHSLFPNPMVIDYYSTRDSVLHRLHPVAKLIFSIAMVCTLVYLQSLPLILVLSALVLVLFAAAKLPLGRALIWSTLPAFFVVSIVLFLPLIGYSWEFIAKLAIKGVTAAWYMFLLVLSTPTMSLGKYISKILPSWLSDAFLLSLRYVFYFFGEAQRVLTAASSRQGEGITWRRRIKLFGAMIVNLILRGYDKTERVYIAMKSRGYTGRVNLVSDERFRVRDAAYTALAVVIPLVLVYLEKVVMLWLLL
ncbi:MAG: energy-coupling factor transporter transmembrane component T family protein [Candidatus Freyarchaeota archaeon]